MILCVLIDLFQSQSAHLVLSGNLEEGKIEAELQYAMVLFNVQGIKTNLIISEIAVCHTCQ